MIHPPQHLMHVEDRCPMLRLDPSGILRHKRVQRIERTVRLDLRDQVPAHSGKVAFDELARAGQDLPGPALQFLPPHQQIGLAALDIRPLEQFLQDRTSFQHLIH
ncbi:hypothetical protein ILFOPFJJ_06992 [Ensifer psoraleae]|nr:hypothetical protein [Sinorhizobium psoraleae]